MRLHLFFLPNFPGATFIPDSRVLHFSGEVLTAASIWLDLTLESAVKTPPEKSSRHEKYNLLTYFNFLLFSIPKYINGNTTRQWGL